MPIIIEGPDGAGKPTLAKSPADRPGSGPTPPDITDGIAVHRFDNDIITEVKDED